MRRHARGPGTKVPERQGEPHARRGVNLRDVSRGFSNRTTFFVDICKISALFTNSIRSFDMRTQFSNGKQRTKAACIPNTVFAPLCRNSSRSGTGCRPVQRDLVQNAQKEARTAFEPLFSSIVTIFVPVRRQQGMPPRHRPPPGTLSRNRAERAAKARKLFERKRLAAARGVDARFREQRRQFARNALPFWSAPGKVRLA